MGGPVAKGLKTISEAVNDTRPDGERGRVWKKCFGQPEQPMPALPLPKVVRNGLVRKARAPKSGFCG